MAGLAENVTILMPKKKVGSQAASAEKKKLRVAAYARVSTDNEEQEGSYEIQVEYYTTLIRNNPDWEFAGVYADEGISGTYTTKRGGFMQMIEDCRARKIDMILTKSISRFARNTVDCLNFTRELKELNIAVRFEKENINTLDASGEVLLTIMAALAQQESESLSQNVRIGIKFRNEQGKVMVNHNRFLGYTKDEDGHLIIDVAQAVIVRRIYDDFLSGMSPRQIKERLEAEGILNGAGNTKWQVSNIHQILTNEKYIGDALLQKTWTYNTLEKKRRKNKTDAPKYYVAGDHEAIVSKETFAAVQQELVRRADMLANGRKKRVYSGKYPFSGLLICGNCGDIFSHVVWNAHGRKHVVWRCSTRMEDGTDLVAGRRVKHVIVDSPALRIPRDLSRLLQMMYEVPQSLFITRQPVVRAVLYEQFLQNVIHRRHAIVLCLVAFEDPQNGAPEWLFVKSLFLCQLLTGILRDNIHGVILRYGRPAGRFLTPPYVVGCYLGLRQPLQL